jgi:prepilin-type processing-associated H-X9-DG protein
MGKTDGRTYTWDGVNLSSMTGISTHVVPTYVCPSDPTGIDGTGGKIVSTFGGANAHAASCYAANYFVFGAPERDTMEQRLEGTGRNSLMRTCPDGLSKTVLFVERYASCGTATGPDDDFVCASSWASSNRYFRPTFSINAITQDPTQKESAKTAPYQCLMFQDTPHWYRNCDPARAQTPHVGAMNVCMADGSVRRVGINVTPNAWYYACDPRDGMASSEEF